MQPETLPQVDCCRCAITIIFLGDNNGQFVKIIQEPAQSGNRACPVVPGLCKPIRQQPMPIFLKGASEVPPVTASATGTGQITVLPNHTVSGSIKTSGLVPTVAHVHEAAVGENGPPIIILTKTADDSFSVHPNAKLTDAQYASFMAGNLNVNVHSAQHPNGEMLAQLPRMETAGTPKLPAY